MSAEQYFIGVHVDAAMGEAEMKEKGFFLYGRESRVVDGVSVVTEGLPKGIRGVVGVQRYKHEDVTALTLTEEGRVYAEERSPIINKGYARDSADLSEGRLKEESRYGKAYTTDIDVLSGVSAIFKTAEEHFMDDVAVDDMRLIRGGVFAEMPEEDLSLGAVGEFHTAIAELKKAAKKAEQK